MWSYVEHEIFGRIFHAIELESKLRLCGWHCCGSSSIRFVLLTLVGGRKEAEVAGRVGMRDVIGAGAVRNVEVTRPAAVAGRAGGRICDFFSERTGGIGTTRTA
jgi:hypothetical protein